jgi:hypothetical protein
LKNPVVNVSPNNPVIAEETPFEEIIEVEEMETEEVTNFAEIVPVSNYTSFEEPKVETPTTSA